MPKQQWSMEVIASQVGARIRFLRFECGLSLRKLAAKTRCSVDSVTQIELGQSTITADMLRRFARALHVQPFDLLNLDTQLDDRGYLVEKMRQDPDSFRIVNASLGRAQRCRLQ